MTHLDRKAFLCGPLVVHNRWSDASKEQVFDGSYIPEPNSGCWIWVGTAYATNPTGALRPIIRYSGERQYAYQYSYQRFVGPVPDGSQICHRCNNPICVNPGHLYAGTSRDNNHDAIEAGTHISVVLKRDAERRAHAEGRVHTPRTRDWGAQYRQRRDRELARKGSAK